VTALTTPSSGGETTPASGGLTILVLAKAPVAGRSKTRLAPRYGDRGAALLAAAALSDTLGIVRRTPCARRVLVLDGQLATDRQPAADGRPAADGPLVERAVMHLRTDGFDVVPQAAGDHAERIRAAFETADGPALLIGMDTPQVRVDTLRLDLDCPVDAWLGLAEDGGWWALGLRHARRDAARVLAGVPMSTDRTGAVQRTRLAEAGLRVAHLPMLRDVDEPDDAVAVAALAPATRFAACLRSLESELAGAGRPGVA